MSSVDRELYSGTCNPPRRAKRVQSTPEQSDGTPEEPPRAMVHIRPYTPRTTTGQQEEPMVPPPPPAKRGRKPGPLSRGAREAQRRLNHSIIEKARRTKINDALATLRQLVPANYGRNDRPQDESQDEDDEDDDEDDPSTTKKAPKKAKPGKREEKEKEFKLEILVRTVSFVQDLIRRVESLEKLPSPSAPSGCERCSLRQDEGKRKRTSSDGDVSTDDWIEQANARPSKNRRLSFVRHDSTPSGASRSPSAASMVSPISLNGEARLPPISSWLPEHTSIDPTALSNKPSSHSPLTPSHLPSPPLSTRFTPIRSTHVPPTLSLGPVALKSSLPTPRTADEENAATLLLQISTSPPFRPINPGLYEPTSGQTYALAEPSTLRLQSDVRSFGRRHSDIGVNQAVPHVQTPGSLLGLGKPVLP